MGVEEDVSLDNDGVVECWLCHLRLDIGQNLTNFVLVRLRLGHVALAELGTARKDLGKILDEGVLIQVMVKPCVALLKEGCYYTSI